MPRCTTYVAEAISKDPNNLYSKHAWYVDPESYCMTWQEIHDQQRQLWKIFVMHLDHRETKTGATRPFLPGMVFVALQRIHTGITNGDDYSDPKISGNVKPTMFTIPTCRKSTEPGHLRLTPVARFCDWAVFLRKYHQFKLLI